MNRKKTRNDIILMINNHKKSNNKNKNNLDLSFSDLSNLDLSNLDLEGVIFIEVNLDGANLQKTNLKEAFFSYTTLQNAKLQGAQLQGAHLLYAELYGAKLQGANLQGADLRNAQLQGAQLQGANLQGAQLQSAKLQGAQLQNAILKGAILERAILEKANLTKANLENANLEGSNLEEARLVDAILINANLYEANLTFINFSGAILSRANFTNADLTGSYLRSTDISNAIGINIEQKRTKTLSIKKNVYQGNNSKNKTCKSYKKLFDFINEHGLSDIKKFNYEGQEGIDEGGLTRDVFDKYLFEFTKKFFEKIMMNEEEFVILKDIKNNNSDKLINSTNHLIQLSKMANTKIYLPINDKLLKIFLNDNPLNQFKTNEESINDFFKIKYGSIEYNKRNKNQLNNLGLNFQNLLLQNNNKNNKNKITEWKKSYTNDEMKQIMFRMFLKSCGFTSFTQFKKMQSWIKDVWNNEVFTNKISFSLPEFQKRIKIIRVNPRKEFNLNSNNQNKRNLLDKYPNLQLLVDYIRKDESNRKKFTKWATGSEYCNDIIRIYVQNNNSINNIPLSVHTCSRDIDVYQTETKLNKNQLNAQINGDIGSTNFSIA